MPPKAKRGQKQAVNMSRIDIQAGVMNPIKAAYYSTDEVGIRRCADTLTEHFKEVSKDWAQLDVFMEELENRILFLTDSVSELGHRIRTLRMIALFALQLNHVEGQTAALDKLVEFTTKYALSKNPVTRMFVCMLMGALYKYNKDFVAKMLEGEVDPPLPKPHYRKLFQSLEKRTRDKEPQVRIEAVRAISFIQDDPIAADHDEACDQSAKELLTTSLGDVSLDCRMEAIRLITTPDGPCTESRHLIEVAIKSDDPKVKEAAYKKIYGIRDIPTPDRIALLEDVFRLQQKGKRGLEEDLIVHWIRHAAAQMKRSREKASDTELYSASVLLLQNLSLERQEELCERVLNVAFGYFSRKKKGVLEFVKALTAEEANVKYLHKVNFKRLLNPGNGLKEQGAMFFHWRMLLQYCTDHYKASEADRVECLHRLAPTLKAYTDFAKEFVALFGAPSNATKRTPSAMRRYESELRRFALCQMVDVYQYLYDQSDKLGMNVSKEFLLGLLSRRTLDYNAELMQEIAANLLSFHYPKDEDTERAIQDFSDQLALIAERARNPDETAMLQNQTMAGGADATMAPAGGTITLDPESRLRSTTVINALLKTGRIRKVDLILDGNFMSAVPDSFVSKNPDERMQAVEAMGIRCIIDKKYAEENITALRLIETNTAVVSDTLAVTAVLCDLVLCRGYARVAAWYAGNNTADGGDPKNPDRKLLGRLIALTEHRDSTAVLSAVECLCKWALIDKSVDWKEVIQRLLFLTFSSVVDKVPRLHSLFECFWPLYASLDRANQVVLCEVFMDAMGALKERDLNDPLLSSINEHKLADFLRELTLFGVLPDSAEGREEGPAHSHLARLILENLQENVDDLFVSIYCKTLSQLEVNTDLTQEQMDELLELTTEIMEDLHEPKDAKLVNLYWKRLNACKERLWNDGDSVAGSSRATPAPSVEPSEETGLDITGATTSTHATTSTVRPKRNKKTPRMPAAKKQFIMQSITEMLSNATHQDRCAAVTTPVTARRTRKVLPRSAKQNNRYLEMAGPESSTDEEAEMETADEEADTTLRAEPSD